jgi:2-phospho-L-lactate guanylyltransferase
VLATAILPVKRFAEAKRRLGGGLADAERDALIESMLADVLAALSRCRLVDAVIVVTSEPAAVALADAAGAEVVDDAEAGGHPAAAALGVDAAAHAGAACVALVPGDCPLLDPAELDGALERAAPGRVAIVPDRHGTGTNALILAPPDAIAPSFGLGSRERHERLAREAGHEAAIEPIRSLALDLDTPDDLEALRDLLDRDPARAPQTAAALAARFDAAHVSSTR